MNMKPLKRLLFIAILGVLFIPLCVLQFAALAVWATVILPISFVLTGECYRADWVTDLKIIFGPIEWLGNKLL